jgi:5-methylcytosine-specific restriction endonuclease McrA
MTKPNSHRIAQTRVTAAWLALDAFTDAATLARMIDVALEGRKSRKEQQRQGDEQPIAMRVRIIERDAGMCYMCRRKLPFEEITLGHVIPRSRGGKTIESNLKVACEPCNIRKGNRLVSECDWLTHLH